MHDKSRLIGVIDEGTKATRFVVSLFFYQFLQIFYCLKLINKLVLRNLPILFKLFYKLNATFILHDN